jgi:TetR/AcrR family transcriptional repressor of nem operon
MRLFAEKGYNSTSVADILKEADVNSGSLYHYFETKQALLCAVLETYRDGIEPMLIAPAWDGVTEPITRIFALLGRYRELLIARECQYGCPIGNLALEIHEPDPPVRQLLAANFDRWTSFVKQCLDAAQPSPPPGTDTQALASFVLTTMEGAVMLARTHRDLKPFDDAIASLRDYLSRLQSPATTSLSNVQNNPNPKSLSP